MPESPKVSYRPGYVEFDYCLLVNYQGRVLDIKDMIVDMNIYYSLFDKHNIHCEIVVADGLGLAELMPIVGDEQIRLSFKTIELEKKSGNKFINSLDFVFQLFKLDEKEKQQIKYDTYILHGVSQEALCNLRKSVNKSFVDLPGETILRSIYDDYLRPTTSDFSTVKADKKFIIDDLSNDNMSIIFNGTKTPQDCIDYLSDEIESKSAFGSSNFIYYETNAGHNFRLLDNLLQQDPVQDFYYGEASTPTLTDDKTSDLIRQDQNISYLSIIRQFDALKNIQSGLYEYDVETIDPILKRFTTDKFVYDSEYNQLGHIDNNKIYTDQSSYASSFNTTKHYYMVSHIGTNYQTEIPYFLQRNAFATDQQIRNPRKRHKFIKYNVASTIQVDNVMLHVTVPGNTDLEVGDVVELTYAQTSQSNDLKYQENKTLGKKYLIVNLRHSFNKTEHNFFTTFECVKDSYASKPEEVRFNEDA